MEMKNANLVSAESGLKEKLVRTSHKNVDLLNLLLSISPGTLEVNSSSLFS